MYADTTAESGKSYCYRVTFRHYDVFCNPAMIPYESPFSNTECNELCDQPEVLITGNNGFLNDNPFIPGPIQTYDFTDGVLVNSFVADGAMTPISSGRGLAIHDTHIFYTELSGNGIGPSDGIHVCPYANQGSGGSDDRTILNPRPDTGIQDLAFHWAQVKARMNSTF